jgi:hypothetical protein
MYFFGILNITKKKSAFKIKIHLLLLFLKFSDKNLSWYQELIISLNSFIFDKILSP